MLRYFETREIEFLMLLLIAFFAFFIRIVIMICLKSYDISAENFHWHFGYETGRVARAIAIGDGFSSPFELGNLSTAWVAPIYPYILSVVFKIFGIYSKGSAFTILLINSLFSSLTTIVIYYIAKTTINRSVGLLSAIEFAFYPPAIWHSINTIWNTALSTFLIAVLVFYFLNTYQRLNNGKSVVCGVLMGLTALTNPIIMAFYPFCFLWLYTKLRNSAANVFMYITLMTISFIITLSPWLVRNYIVFDKFILVKGTLGVELRLGNNPNATGSFEMKGDNALHPTFSKKEMVLFNELKEVGYVKYSSREALNFMIKNPLKILSLSANRFSLFWLGDLLEENNWKGNLRNIDNLSIFKKILYILPVPFLLFGIVMAWKNRIDISIFLYLLLSYPLIYYVTHVSNRYRHPIEPFCVIIGAYGIVASLEKLKIIHNGKSILNVSEIIEKNDKF